MDNIFQKLFSLCYSTSFGFQYHCPGNNLALNSAKLYQVTNSLLIAYKFCFQYIYLIVLKSYAATVHEDFWSFYLNIWTFLYSMISSYLYMEIPGKFATNYYICQGLNPKVDQYDVDKVKNDHNLENHYQVLKIK